MGQSELGLQQQHRGFPGTVLEMPSNHIMIVLGFTIDWLVESWREIFKPMAKRGNASGKNSLWTLDQLTNALRWN